MSDCSVQSSSIKSSTATPTIITTWAFSEATDAAWESLESTGSGLDAVVAGCSYVENDLSVWSVGYGGSPDENGETTLDAMIMDGVTHDVGSVAGLRRVKNAISVARAVMQYTKHTLLVGSLATDFAKSMGFREEDLSTNHSLEVWKQWKNYSCQPNFRQNVAPDPGKSCGPYRRSNVTQYGNPVIGGRYNPYVNHKLHDTVGMVVVDREGNISGGTSTNGATWKVPGRVGDSPIIGAGAYVDNDVGAAAATGDGDVMMRFLPSFYAVDLMSEGMSPTEACKKAIVKIARYYPKFNGAVIALNKTGAHGAACHNFEGKFQYSVRSSNMVKSSVIEVSCS